MLRLVMKKFQPLDNLPMNRLKAIVLHLVFVLIRADAESSGFDYPPPDYASLKPSLAVVIGILSVMFVATFLLLAYTKFCHRPREPARAGGGQNQAALISSSSRFSGIDKTVVESLPFFRFSSLKGSREGLECAVCLSKFEDVEILRLLPKCKHAFHIDCIDHWLEKHSSCPLCRHRVSDEDLKLITYSNSMRFLWTNDQSEPREDSNNIELFVQREESRRGSSRFSIGSSFRKVEKRGCDEDGEEKESSLMMLTSQEEGKSDQKAVFHRHNHRIVVSEFVFKSRWSNVSSSDLIFLSSEMLNDASSGRFSPKLDNNETSPAKKAVESEEIMGIKEEMEIKKSFENKVGTISTTGSVPSSAHNKLASSSRSIVNSSGEQRSVSEITAFSRYRNSGVKNGIVESSSSSSLYEESVREERIRRVWLPIARRTVQWFANREQRNIPQRQTLEV